jgi:hypothetical protein
MIPGMVIARMSLKNRSAMCLDPNHRQQLALDRVEFAIDELASVLLASCREPGVAGAAIHDVRRAVAPILADILTAD